MPTMVYTACLYCIVLSRLQREILKPFYATFMLLSHFVVVDTNKEEISVVVAQGLVEILILEIMLATMLFPKRRGRVRQTKSSSVQTILFNSSIIKDLST